MKSIKEYIDKYINKYNKVENIITIIIVLVVIMISFNYIFLDETDEKVKTEKNIPVKEVSEESLETKIENILDEITNSDNSKVLITYSESEKIIPIYEIEDNKEDKEKNKNIVFEEVSGDKLVAKEGTVYPKIDGIIIVTNNITSEELKLKIVRAISSIASVPEYKVKIFNN